MQLKDLKYHGKGTWQGREQSNAVIWKQKKYSEAKEAWCYFIFLKLFRRNCKTPDANIFKTGKDIYMYIFLSGTREEYICGRSAETTFLKKKKKVILTLITNYPFSSCNTQKVLQCPFTHQLLICRTNNNRDILVLLLMKNSSDNLYWKPKDFAKQGSKISRPERFRNFCVLKFPSQTHSAEGNAQKLITCRTFGCFFI